MRILWCGRVLDSVRATAVSKRSSHRRPHAIGVRRPRMVAARGRCVPRATTQRHADAVSPSKSGIHESGLSGVFAQPEHGARRSTSSTRWCRQGLRSWCFATGELPRPSSHSLRSPLERVERDYAGALPRHLGTTMSQERATSRQDEGRSPSGLWECMGTRWRNEKNVNG